MKKILLYAGGCALLLSGFCFISASTLIIKDILKNLRSTVKT